MMMMTYDDNVFVWSWHSHNFIIFIHNIFFCNISSLFFLLYLWNKLTNDNYNTIVLNNIYCCYYHHRLCHVLFHLHCYYHQQHFHHHHHITSSTFNVSSLPFLYANHQHHLYHLIYSSSSVSSPLIIIY